MRTLAEAIVITAIKTPYLPNGDFDLERYDRLVEYQIAAKVDGIIVGGTTGEGHLMSWDEHIMLIAHSVHKYGKQLLVIGNTGSNNTKEALIATRQGFAVGMHGALQINPYYGKTSLEGLKRHFFTLLDLGPSYIYNVPGRTGQDLQPLLIEALAKHPNFIGVKECAGNDRIHYYHERGIACWSGNDDQAFAAKHRHGGRGVISVLSNLVPGLVTEIMTDPNSSWAEKLVPLISWLFSEPNPIPVNTALAMMGAALPVFRLPYVPMNTAQRQLGFDLLQLIPVQKRIVDKLQLLQEQDFILCGG